ncbi:MAG: hypothetical protein ACYDB7_14490 [Mycobacteriales bacterium]
MTWSDGPRRAGRGGGFRRDAEPGPVDGLAGWLAGRLPDGWFTGPPEVTVDRDEILVVGTLEAPTLPAGAAPAETAEAEVGRIGRFREETREARMAIAREAVHRYGRTLSWGAHSGGTARLFTTAAVPVMTRLRQPQRQVLDTLVDSGVARSRAEALVWCVRLVGDHADKWLAELREAVATVEQVRATGPGR